MEIGNLDKRINNLEEIMGKHQLKIKQLEDALVKKDKDIQRLKDVHEIQNLMGLYLNLQEVGDMKILELYAKKTPGVTFEVANTGVFEGVEGAGRAMAREPQRAVSPGWMVMHTLTTPIIEVAGDGKTAKGVWISTGHETGKDPNGTIEAFWVWTKYGCDFVKEDGEWKVWHYHVYGIFRTPFDKCWTEEFEHKVNRAIIDIAAPKPDRPPTVIDTRYSSQYLTHLIPEPPLPYQTFDSEKAY